MFTQNWIDTSEICPQSPDVEILSVDVGSGQFQFTSNVSGGSAPYSYSWSVSPATGFTNNTGNLTSDNLDITVTSSGSYLVQLIVTEAGGANTRAIQSIEYTVTPSNADVYAAAYDDNYA